ncbi:hypothetical protein CLIM01_11317 [Colletotrichum limetticola]|uniref:Uncharacterized protein n=1 Tax=Colletotrichum limetticola TaxID=1209924 RepID=A0ABQ9PHT5_9PEZI|nr:hypothetical protein CLIM01_11317 [Colletotrichum limetticola]
MGERTGSRVLQWVWSYVMIVTSWTNQGGPSPGERCRGVKG